MTDWCSEYTAALQARDTREQAHKQYIDAYTRLADKQATTIPSAQPSPVPDVPPQRTSILGTPLRPARSTPPIDDQAALRADLASTQKARATLAATLKDVETQLASLQAERKESTAQIAALSRAKLDAERRLRDRTEELKGKAGLVDRVQNEMVSLEMQLNLAEDRAEKLTKENKELVDRWMRRMGEEADKVNRDSRWS